jgi:hypothetical protein
VRVLELTAHVDAMSRGEGRSATAAAAYRACCVIECEREGRTHDYTRKRGLEHSEIVLPDGAPAWAADRSKLWNAVELREMNKDRRAKQAEKAKAQVAREVMFAFPAELSAEGRRTVAQRMARHLVNTHGVGVDYSLHLPGRDGDQQNFHCHMMMTTRRLNQDGLGEKVREWSGKFEGRAQMKDLRAVIAGVMNDQLRQEGKAHLVHVEHRSFKTRGSDKRRTIHQGPTRTNIQRKQKGVARQAWEREQKTAMQTRHGKEIAALKTRQEFALQAKSGQWAERQRTGEAAIKRELDAQREADRAQQKTGIRSVFRNITGRAGRDASGQQTREAQRVEMAQQKVEALRSGIAAERREFIAVQQQERGALIDSHRQDGAKIQNAVEARHQIDRGAERAARQPQAQAQERQHQQQHERGRSAGRDFTP